MINKKPTPAATKCVSILTVKSMRVSEKQSMQYPVAAVAAKSRLVTHLHGDGKGFVFLAIDTIPDCVDTLPLPAGPRPACGNQSHLPPRRRHVGQWSDVVSIPVAGGTIFKGDVQKSREKYKKSKIQTTTSK